MILHLYNKQTRNLPAFFSYYYNSPQIIDLEDGLHEKRRLLSIEFFQL